MQLLSIKQGRGRSFLSIIRVGSLYQKKRSLEGGGKVEGKATKECIRCCKGKRAGDIKEGNSGKKMKRRKGPCVP
jgi:hypothetical protein